jgi:hypothetical protein
MSRQRLFIAVCFLYSTVAVAGPNWDAIDDARKEKAAEKQQVKQEAVKQQHQQSAFERLQAACNKVQHDDEVKAACKEMIEAAKEMAPSSGSAAQ